MCRYARDGPRTSTLTHSERLRHVDHLVIEQDLDIGQVAQAFEKELCGLELLALHDERMPRVVGENGMVELRDELRLGRSQN